MVCYSYWLTDYTTTVETFFKATKKSVTQAASQQCTFAQDKVHKDLTKISHMYLCFLLKKTYTFLHGKQQFQDQPFQRKMINFLTCKGKLKCIH